jgi:hypothetical protein
MPNSTKQSLSWETGTRLASQEIKPKIHYCVHKSLPPMFVPSQIN